jgi:hypothetical protein
MPHRDGARATRGGGWPGASAVVLNWRELEAGVIDRAMQTKNLALPAQARGYNEW